ncbi:MAG: nitroreductase family protein [Candidatus Omnitrophica bacterium]|nr:nitroreductase family protein [Candidatus Omnitrophota bacterium]
MHVDSAIKGRRSVREYGCSMPEDKDIRAVLEAGVRAPSGLNNQPWRFKVVDDGNTLSAMAEYTKYGDVIKNAPVVICVFLDREAVYDREKDIMAVGACIQNILLSAYGRGLGTCWLGEILNRKDEVTDLLGVPSGLELMAVITAGEPSGIQEKRGRLPLDEVMIR